MTVRPAWLPNPGQTRQDTRQAPIGTMTPIGSLSSRSGIIPGPTALLLTGSGMTGSVSVGRAVLQGTSAQGAYPVAVTAAEAITVPNGHLSLARIDSVFLIAYDQLFDTSGLTLARVEYVQGTAAASPVAPSAPATTNSALRLWDILVPAGASAGSPINWATALTDQRVYTVAVGGIAPASDAVAGAYSGQYRDNAGVLERWSGSAWVPWSSALRGIAPSSLASGSYSGQWRDGAISLERWNGSAWSKGLGEYQAFTPTWTASTTNPTLGNGTLNARYCRIGRQITYEGTLQLGSTSNGGTGTWAMSLPVAAANLAIYQLGACDYTVLSSNDYLGTPQIDPNATAMIFIVKTGTSSSSSSAVTNAVPAGASASTRLSWNITYEAAS